MVGPCLHFGDFNAILYSSEKQSTRQPNIPQINASKEALESCQLEDLGYKGYPFTWTNKRPGDANTKLRLDRAVATNGWIEIFQVSNVVHLLPHASDHIPIAIQVQKFRQKHRKADFKFEESWLLWDECEDRVQQAWSLASSGDSGLVAVHAKIRVCGDDLKVWGDTRTRPEEEKIKSLQNRLEIINRNNTTDESKVEYLEISK